MSYEQTQLFFTADDVVAQTTKAVNEAYADVDLRIQRAKDNLNATHAEGVLGALRDLADNGTLTNDEAIETYNTIADRLGWDNIETLMRKFTVAVNYKGYTVAEFEDVEAENEERAGEIVLEDADIEASISVTISYKGESGSYDIDIDSWELDDSDFDTDVSEQ
jgi:hypothetical protein